MLPAARMGYRKSTVADRIGSDRSDPIRVNGADKDWTLRFLQKPVGAPKNFSTASKARRGGLDIAEQRVVRFALRPPGVESR
ncbi:hypothetical protein MPTK1_5g17990 [Marchantia polymorpha subsp. ruderalis]